MSNKVIGVILAGGKGSRMYPFSEKTPKPILPILGKPLLEYQLEIMSGLGITEVVIVIGHYGFEVVKVLGNGSRFKLDIHYVDQGETNGIAAAVGKLEPMIDAPFLLFLGDVFFHAGDLATMFEEFFSGKCDAVLATKTEGDLEALRRNFCVITGEDGFVKKVIEKPRKPPSNEKGCGIYLFDFSIFDAIRSTPRTAMRDEYEITNSIQILIDMGYKVKSMQIVEDDLNLTDPTDLLEANMRELSRRALEKYIGNDCRIHPNCILEKTVVGAGSVIEHPIVITESVIFPGCKVSERRNFNRCIITGEHVIPL